MSKYRDPSDYWWDKATNSMRGDFESMYVDIDDPWNCSGTVDSVCNDLFLALLQKKAPIKRLLDVGCGAGALTHRMYQELALPPGGGSEFIGYDISATAIQRATADYGGPELTFRTGDCTQGLATEGLFDVIIMSEILWYVLADIDQLLQRFAKLLTDGGICAIHQYFPIRQSFAQNDCAGITGFFSIVRRSPFMLDGYAEYVETASGDRVLLALLAIQ